ncbi:ABC transporter ATP-binding protein [Castellaniella sp. S9]|uniref:ABC transporter ATP-binding protein n=1 Tax=Castellaniella sp. S9 TaxID=2993652 RepID=UPI0022B50671|nr:ABC transporter ATP-binding protein [Castellaniella sp. S9]
MPPRLALDNISKSYPTVRANDGVSLAVQPGEIHAVLGENGAGKSTLMKIIYGVVRPDSGTVQWDGRPVQISSPAEARALGLGMVFQHFSLFDTLTVAENIALGLSGDTDIHALEQRIADTVDQYGLELEPGRHVHTLSVGERQRVEIVRALLGGPRLLILDEPTSVLTPQAVRRLFDILRQLADEGCSILYISHKLDEIRSLCHTCTVMRAGRVTGQCDPRLETEAGLSRLMIGTELPTIARTPREAGEVVLQVRGLNLPRAHPFATPLRDVSFELRAGEILGIAGVSGNGQQELMTALSGEDVRAAADSVRIDGEAAGQRTAAWRRGRGLAFVPEERLGRGAVPELSLARNILLSHQDGATVWRGFVREGAVRALAAGIIQRFRVKAPGPQALAGSLSGGNLQKYIVGREVVRRPRLLLVAQPTWGVDVGAAAQIRGELLALRDAGCAILLISEELDELFEISDRLVVIAKGRISPSVPIGEAQREQIGQWMSGLWPGAEAGTDVETADLEAVHA